MDDKKKVPKLRFKGFTDDWEQRKLLDMLIHPITDGPHETPKLVKKGIPFISVEAIVDGKLDFTRKRGCISSDYNDQCNKKYKPQIHDVYLVKSGSTVGKVAIVETNKVFNIWSPLAAMRVNKYHNSYFLYFLLQTDKLQDQIKKKSKGGTQPNLSMRILEKCSTNYTNFEEETKIAKLLNKIDQQLVLQQRKLQQLKLLKKVMLQDLFTDKKVPKLRFSGFEEDWAQRKLGEISIVNFGKDYKQLNKGNIPVYGTGGYMLSVDQSLSKNDAVGIGRKGTIDHPQYLKAPFWTVDTLFFITVRENNNLNYLYSLFQKINWKKYDESTGLPSLSKKTINTISVKVPEYIEQKRIGNFISQVDSLLSLQQNELKYLQKIKQFLLQNMFI